MTHQDSETTRLLDYIAEVLPWAPGQQLKGITPVVGAIIEKHSGHQAELARGLGNQEAAVKRLSRLLHNERLAPYRLAGAVLAQALRQLPPRGKVRLALDWTIEGSQHLRVVSLVTGGRAVPIYWRAYDATVLKGRRRRYEQAVIRRAVRRMQGAIGRRRLIVTADRGFADVALVDVLTELGGNSLSASRAAPKSASRASGATSTPCPLWAIPASATWALWPIVRVPRTGCG